MSQTRTAAALWRLTVAFALTAAFALGTGCDEASECTAGAIVDCTCFDGKAGTRTCQADGTLAACSCASTPDVTVPDVVGDGACTPDCSVRTCGDDGCGGTCGTCVGAGYCTGGACHNCEGAGTCCTFGYLAQDPSGKDFGEGCTQDGECAFFKCMQPGEDGNTTNSLFGFCTRGCECNNDTASQLSEDEKASRVCVYPTGNQGGWRHVAVRCSTLADCKKLDSRWTDCKAPTDFGVGTTKMICVAE